MNFLSAHRDSSHVSFNVLLNEDFEGGGTRFYDPQQTVYDIRPNRGEVLLNNALLLHEGLPTTKGTRYIMVGFMNVDTTNPMTGQTTGVSPFATWLSFPWMEVRFKDGVKASLGRRSISGGEEDGGGFMERERRWIDHKYALGLFRDLNRAFDIIIQLWIPFLFTQLVDKDNFNDYLTALDNAFRERTGQSEGGEAQPVSDAEWFKGQQIDLDIDGSIARVWKTRREAGEAKFAEL